MLVLKSINKEFYTAGVIAFPDGTEIKTLELPWLNNQNSISCIPEGTYIVDRDTTGSQQWYRFRNKEVAPRSNIEVHPANYLTQLQGCIAPCMSINEDDPSEPVALESWKACELLLKWFGNNSFALKIERIIE